MINFGNSSNWSRRILQNLPTLKKMLNDIKKTISKCERCQLNKSKLYSEPTKDIPTEVE